MHKLQEVVRLHRLGTRTIARQLRTGRDTTGRRWSAFREAVLFDGEPSDLPELNTLRALIEDHAPSKQGP